MTKQAASFRFSQLGSESIGDPTTLIPFSGIPDDFMFEASVGILQLKPYVLRDDFWAPTSPYRLSGAQIRKHDGEWKEAYKNTFISKTHASAAETPTRTPLVPTYAPLNDFISAWASGCVWVMEGIEPLRPNEGISVSFGLYGINQDAPPHQLVLGLGDLAWVVHSDMSISMFRRTNSDEWIRLGTVVHSQGAINPREMRTLTILPLFQEHFAFYLSERSITNRRHTAALYTGQKGSEPRSIRLSDGRSDFEPEYDSTLQSWIKHRGGTLTIGVIEEGVNVHIGINRVRYPVSASAYLQPEIWFQFDDDRTIGPTVEPHVWTNGGSVTATAREPDGSGPATPSTNPVAIRLEMASFVGFHSPELAAVSIGWPTELFEPADATEDLSDKWQLVRFESSEYFSPGKIEAKVRFGRTADNLDRLEQPPRSIEVSVWDEDAEDYEVVSVGFVDEARPTPTGDAGLFAQLDGLDLLQRGCERQVGMIPALNGLSLSGQLQLLASLMGFPPERIHIDDNIGEFENGTLPEDWLTVIEDQKPSNIVRHIQEIMFGYLIVKVRGYDFYAYREQPWDGVEPEIVFTDVDDILGGLTYAQRMALPQKVVKIRSLPEFINVGAKVHRLSAMASEGTGEGRRFSQIIQCSDRVWTDPNFEDFEGRKESRVYSPPRLTAASEGALRKSARTVFERDGRPGRIQKFEGEFHQSIREGLYSRVIIRTEDGFSDRGIWRIKVMSTEVEFDSSDLMKETWRCSYELMKRPT